MLNPKPSNAPFCKFILARSKPRSATNCEKYELPLSTTWRAEHNSSGAPAVAGSASINDPAYEKWLHALHRNARGRQYFLKQTHFYSRYLSTVIYVLSFWYSFYLKVYSLSRIPRKVFVPIDQNCISTLFLFVWTLYFFFLLLGIRFLRFFPLLYCVLKQNFIRLTKYINN